MKRGRRFSAQFGWVDSCSSCRAVAEPPRHLSECAALALKHSTSPGESAEFYECAASDGNVVLTGMYVPAGFYPSRSPSPREEAQEEE